MWRLARLALHTQQTPMHALLQLEGHVDYSTWSHHGLLGAMQGTCCQAHPRAQARMAAVQRTASGVTCAAIAVCRRRQNMHAVKRLLDTLS
eukprot:4134401-Amphidinium_carterae.1